jgi:protein-tyrosine-phosphatase
MAAALLQRRLDLAEIDAEVVSAGFGPGGLPALDEVVEVMLELGLDLSQQRSRRVTQADVSTSDLIIVMTRQQAMEAVLLAPPSWPRTFPMVDLVRRAARTGPPGPNESLGEWVARVHGGRQRSDLLALRLSDDIGDPAGSPSAVVRRTRDLLSSLVDEFVQLISAGPPPG